MKKKSQKVGVGLKKANFPQRETGVPLVKITPFPLGDSFPMPRSGSVGSCYCYPALLEEASRVLPPIGEKWAVGMASTGTTKKEQEKGPHGAGWEAHSWQCSNPN